MPNDVDTTRLRLARRHNNGGRARRFSTDPARRRWYATNRTARLATR